MSKSAIDIRGTRTERKSTLAATVVVADLGLAKALLEPPNRHRHEKGNCKHAKKSQADSRYTGSLVSREGEDVSQRVGAEARRKLAEIAEVVEKFHIYVNEVGF